MMLAREPTDITDLPEHDRGRRDADTLDIGQGRAGRFDRGLDPAVDVLDLAVQGDQVGQEVDGKLASGRCRWREGEYRDVEPLLAEHSSASSGSRRGLAEIVAVALGLTSIILYAGLKLAIWLIEPGGAPLEAYLLFGPPLLLTCPGTVVALVVPVLQRRGRLRASTWLLALPAVLLSAQVAVSSVGARPPPELRPIPVEPQPDFVPPSFPAVPTFPSR